LSARKSLPKNSGTGIAVESETNEAGSYTIPNLGAADYEVTVTATGFKTAVSKVSLIVGAKQQMNFAMTVGEVAQTVEVTAAAPQVDLTSSTITDEVSASTVRELPLNGRDWHLSRNCNRASLKRERTSMSPTSEAAEAAASAIN